MELKSLFKLPKRRTPPASLPAYYGPAFASRPPHFKSLSLFLSSCTITSTLGAKGTPCALYFTYFIAEDPLIATFSCHQDPHIPLSRRRKVLQRRHRDDSAIRRLWTQLFPWCEAKIVIETRDARWEYTVPRRAMKWCCSDRGVLLLDWQALYVECFEEEQRRRVKEEQRKAGNAVGKRMQEKMDGVVKGHLGL
ncbi:hypothetical protein T440DRAFT_222687 [Plenodomus tracheiphilus IPT5]|uniref:Uncharacterized protein n=1 Tax=Plenodomus tracheiphilus IPT5 TaxID=1408161 RepID=A0A6A7AX52_9PLEO|nr:hypothetical protein T440DRAFT_222687 [Plenodomus tracheiphilus IPT5]